MLDEMIFLALSQILHTVHLAKPRASWVLAMHSHFTSLLIVSNLFSILIVSLAFPLWLHYKDVDLCFSLTLRRKKQILLKKGKGTHHNRST
jgi:hypothetical protein